MIQNRSKMARVLAFEDGVMFTRKYMLIAFFLGVVSQ
jgi:hypothetical protein